MFSQKLIWTAYRSGWFFQKLPGRLLALAKHLVDGSLHLFRTRSKAPTWRRIGYWWVELPFYFMGLLGVPEWYETLTEWGKNKTRPLSEAEIALARSVFGDAIRLDRVRVDERAKIACRSHHLLYVSFHTINSWGEIRPDIFIHELVHVWQYERMGIAYIPKALSAQWTPMGYNYGGWRALQKAFVSGGSLLDFNLEQQADIVSDYFRIRQGYHPSWGDATWAELCYYEPFLQEIRGNRKFAAA